MMCDLQMVCGQYNAFMTLCIIRHTEKVRGPRASVWITLGQLTAPASA